MQDGVSTTTLRTAGPDRFHWLAADLGVESFGLSQIRLAPGQRGRIHAHGRQEEVLVVLEGVLTVELADGERHELARGDAIRIAPAVRRQLSNHSTEPVVLLAVGGSEPHVGRDGIAFTSWDDTAGQSPRQVPTPEDLPPEDLSPAVG